MSTTPHVFISATTGDLGPTREIAKQALLTIDCKPVEQTNFTPSPSTVRQMLKEKVEQCQAVIHIVGQQFGAEPSDSDRSYTQFERDHAHSRDVPVYIFLCSNQYPFAEAEPVEDPGKTQRQMAYRAQIEGHGNFYTSLDHPGQLKESIYLLQRDLHALAEFSPNELTAKLRRHIETQFHEKLEAVGGDQATYPVLRDLEKQRDLALGQIEGLLATITAGLAHDADPVFTRATQLLEYQGLEDAMGYLEDHRVTLLSEADKIQEQLEAHQRQLRHKLEPLLMQAGLHQTNLEWEPALAVYRDVARRAPQWFRARRELGELLRELAKVKQAEPHLYAALDLAETEADRALALNSLAFLLDNLARHAEAEPLLREALALLERLHGPHSTEVAALRNNLGALLEQTNRLEEAEQHYRRALAIAEASYGPDDPNLAVAVNNLGGLLQQTNRLEEAEQHYRRVVEIFETSPDISSSQKSKLRKAIDEAKDAWEALKPAKWVFFSVDVHSSASSLLCFWGAGAAPTHQSGRGLEMARRVQKLLLPRTG